MNKINEECGVVGICSPKPYSIAQDAYYALYALQHRGQESCGITVNDDGIFKSVKDLGEVANIFDESVLSSLPDGSMAVGHVRYSTTGADDRSNAQPMLVNHQKGKLALAHNGNISNAYDLRSRLELGGAIFHSTSDTEIIAYLVTQARLKTKSIEDAVLSVMPELEGAYSLVLMSSAKLIAVRDPHGFRPLCYGMMPDGGYIVASESCALEAVGASFARDIAPGEVVVFSAPVHDSYIQKSSLSNYCGAKDKKTCIFEYIYFARPDSVIDGISVHEARLRAGRILAEQDGFSVRTTKDGESSCTPDTAGMNKSVHGTSPLEADVVIGVPDSGLDAALGYSHVSGIPYGIGFVKNKYIGRTFISPTQNERRNQVRIKLNPIRSTVEGKRVVLIDDSIVRGTTSEHIVGLLREAGAKEIHMRISSPPFLNPCYYGTDIDSKENLIANQHTVDEIAKLIGADSLSYLPVERLCDLINSDGYCDACFTGRYATPIPENTAKDRFEKRLSLRQSTSSGPRSGV